MKLSEVIPKFLAEQDIQPQSRYMYHFAINRYFRWAQANKMDPERMTIADVVKYKSEMEASHLSVASVKNYLTVVRLFYRWAKFNHIHEDITETLRSPKHDKSFKKYPLRKDQAESLINSIDTSTKFGKRDKAMITLMLFNGLRRIELQRINIGDIDPGEEKLRIQGKGRTNKDQYVMIRPVVLDAINDYLVTRQSINDSDPLFANRYGNRMSLVMISRIVKYHMIRQGIDDKYHTCHSLRHTTASLLLESGMSLDEIKGYLRHQSINTTMLYLGLVAEQNRLKNKPGIALENIIQITPK